MIPKTPENYRLLATHIFETRMDDFFPCYERFTPEEKEHIIGIAASVMMDRDRVMMGGGFANAIVNNDLFGAFSRADSTIVKAIRFMVYVMNYVRIESNHSIFEEVETN